MTCISYLKLSTINKLEINNIEVFSRKTFCEYLARLQENIHAKVWLQLYWNHTLDGYASYLNILQNWNRTPFFREHISGTASLYRSKCTEAIPQMCTLKNGALLQKCSIFTEYIVVYLRNIYFYNKVEITLLHGCSPVNWLNIRRITSLKITSRWLLIYIWKWIS